MSSIIYTPCTYNIPTKINTLENRVELLEKSSTSSGGGVVSSNTRLYTLREAMYNWYSGEKFPIAFYGDSTTDGNATTGEATNTVGTDITDENGNDTQSPNAYPQKLQELLREETGNNSLRIYNAGYSAKTMLYGISQYENCFVNGDFSDAKMIGIRFGINDSGDNGTDIKTSRTTFKTNLVTLINKIIADNKQPFLVTTQPFVKPQADWKLKDAGNINIVVNEVYREVAEEYNLEILDIADKCGEFLTYSQYPISESTDRSFHFKDSGHLYEAGLLFKLISKRVINVNPLELSKIDYTSQYLGTYLQNGTYKTPVTANMLNFTKDTNGFNCYANYTKSDTSDTKIFDAYIFNDGKSKINIKAYITNHDKQYVKIDGVTKNLTGTETDLGNYDLGLHHLEVFTGESRLINFSGFKIS